MGDTFYWVPFKIKEPGCSFVVRGPFKTHEEAMEVRESMKRTAAMNEYVGIPLIASSEEEALERAPFF
jgi:hypothetical protein